MALLHWSIIYNKGIRNFTFLGVFFNIKDIDFLPGLKGESQQKVLLSNDNTIFSFTSSV